MHDGYPIDVDGDEILYLTPDCYIDSESEPMLGYSVVDDLELRSHPRMRRVILPFGPNKSFFGFLHWSDGTDLSELDRQVAARSHDPASFNGAITVESRSVNCLNCAASVRLAIASMGMQLATTERYRKHEFHRLCPVCREDLRLPYAEELEF